MVTIAKGLYHYSNMGENGGWGERIGKRGGEREIPIPTKLYPGK